MCSGLGAAEALGRGAVWWHRQPLAAPPCPGAGTDQGDLWWIGVTYPSGAGDALAVPASVCLWPPCCSVPPAWRSLVLDAPGTRYVVGAWGDAGPSGTELLPAMSAGPWSAPLGVSGHSHFVLGHMDSTWLSNPEISSLSQNLQNSG